MEAFSFCHSSTEKRHLTMRTLINLLILFNFYYKQLGTALALLSLRADAKQSHHFLKENDEIAAGLKPLATTSES